jgi:hypothetical protein
MFVEDYAFVELFEPCYEKIEMVVGMLGDLNPLKISLEHDQGCFCSPPGLVLTLQTSHSVRVC